MRPSEYLKSHVTLRQVIETYTPVKRNGRSLVCSCPLHEDKTPSMSINEAKGLWKCFSCDKGGDMISLVKEVEGVSFLDACRIIIERFRIPPPAKILNRSIIAQIKELEAAGRIQEARELSRELRQTV